MPKRVGVMRDEYVNAKLAASEQVAHDSDEAWSGDRWRVCS